MNQGFFRWPIPDSVAEPGFTQQSRQPDARSERMYTNRQTEHDFGLPPQKASSVVRRRLVAGGDVQFCLRTPKVMPVVSHIRGSLVGVYRKRGRRSVPKSWGPPVSSVFPVPPNLGAAYAR